MKKLTHLLLLVFIAVSIGITSCGEEKTKEETPQPDPKPDPDPQVDEHPMLQGKIFSFPSPIEIAKILGKADMPYNNTLLNLSENEGMYATKFKKSLNLGVYGADLGYAVLYEDKNLSGTYLKTIRNVAQHLSIDNALGTYFLNRIEQNLENTDSLLVMVGESYSGMYDYLANNDRLDVVSLMEAGTWIEALYITSQLNESNKNDDITALIAQQKSSLNNLIQMLEQETRYEEDQDCKALITMLKTLVGHYDKVKATYQYELPFTDSNRKLTELKSSTQYEISDETLANITQTLAEIRTKIVD